MIHAVGIYSISRLRFRSAVTASRASRGKVAAAEFTRTARRDQLLESTQRATVIWWYQMSFELPKASADKLLKVTDVRMSFHSIECLLQNFHIRCVPDLLSALLNPLLFQRIFGRSISFVKDSKNTGER